MYNEDRALSMEINVATAPTQSGLAKAESDVAHAAGRPSGWVSGWRGSAPWVGFALRLLLGLVWLTFGAAKVRDLAASVEAVRAYRILPAGVEPIVGSALPLLEIVLGLMLIFGAVIRFSALVSVVLLAFFIAGIASVAARGIRIDCGCLGGGGVVAAGSDTHYASDILRDAGLIVAAGWLALWPHSPWSLDRRWDRKAQIGQDSEATT